jgi:hypothetical protein
VGVELSSSSDGGVAADDVPVVYPTALLALVWTSGFVALFWTLYFFLVVSPALQEDMDREASHRYDDRQLRQSCFTIVCCFYLFVAVRALMLLKPIGRRLQAAQRGHLGSSMMYVSFAVLYGPLLIFTALSGTFWLQELARGSLRDSRDIHEHDDTQLTSTLRMFGSYSVLVVIMSCGAVIWSGLIAIEARRSRVQKMRATPDLITRIPTVPYDPDLFGEEDDRRYAGMCSICLGEFEAEDDISVPICGHAFHRQCLGRWLRSHSTCAVCRQDVAQASEALAEDVGYSAQVAVPGARGLGEAAPGAAAAAHSGAIPV